MTEKIHQRICIKFCQKLNDSCKETYEKLKEVYGEDCMSRSQVYEWYKRFKYGRDSFASYERCGRPSTSKNEYNIELVRAAVHENNRITIRELSDILKISAGSVQSILRDDLRMRRVSAKYVPKSLTAELKHARITACIELLRSVDMDENFLNTIITGGELWVYRYEPITKGRISKRKTQKISKSRKAKQSRCNARIILTIFFDHEGIVHHEYGAPGKQIIKEHYNQVLQRLNDAVRCKRPVLYDNNSWHLHIDNMPEEEAPQYIAQFLGEHNISQIYQPPYSPDLAPCNFFLFPKLIFTMKRKVCENLDEIKQNTTNQLYAISRNDFKKCFQQWKQRWTKCVSSDGAYFGGDFSLKPEIDHQI